MAVSLNNFSRPSGKKTPLLMLVYSEHGMGKTTLAAMFPAPIFLRTEDGSKVYEDEDYVNKFDIVQTNEIIKSSDELLDYMDFFLHNETDRKSIIIDSISALHPKVEYEVMREAGEPSIKSGKLSFEVGEKRCAMIYNRLVQKAVELKAKGFNVIFLAGSGIRKMKSDVECEPYTTLATDLNAHCEKPFEMHCDVVALITKDKYVSGTGDVKKVRSANEPTAPRRVIVDKLPAFITKNKLHIHEDLSFDLSQGNPFSPYLPE